MSEIIPYGFASAAGSPSGTNSGTNSATVNALGGMLLATGPGFVASAVIQVAGSSNSYATIFDGTSTSGRKIAEFLCSKVGAAQMPNLTFTSGLFVQVSGSSAGVLVIEYTGAPA